ncbi:MAG: hypothetical protein ACFFD4_05920 [Candidatus Odinarchaeota archaeon]
MHKRIRGKRGKKKLKEGKGLVPILGIHSKFDLKIMKEPKPLVDKKTQKKLKMARYREF